MHNPLVSIVIPTYNRAYLIGETLDSISVQTYTNWECIIVDDGSSDTTKTVVANYIRRDNRFKYFNRPLNKPKGANSCRNYGFELSQGEFVNWFDDDDVMHKDKLLIQINALINSNYSFSVCQTEIFEIGLNNSLGLRHPDIFSVTPFQDFLKNKIIWLTNPVIWKRDVLISLSHLFDEELEAAQEWEFQTRVLLEFNNYHYTDQVLVFNRKHLNSITYNSNVNKRKFNYFIARLKIYNLIKFRDDLEDSKKYLRQYFLSYIKKTIKDKDFKRTLYVYKNFIKKDSPISFKSKIALLISIGSFSLFNRGQILLEYVKLK